MEPQAHAASAPIWTPSPERIDRALLTSFRQWLHRNLGLDHQRYEDLWQWSVDDPDAFWDAIWKYFDLPANQPYTSVRDGDTMPGVRWFPGARLNIVNQLLRGDRADGAAICFESEAMGTGTLSLSQLRAQVASVAAWLRDHDVRPGDRVAAILPNVPQAVIAFLAVASVGAVWSLCSPDMGPVSVGDRFSQIRPKVLIACDGYRFGGKEFDRRDALREVVAGLDGLEHLVWVPVLEATAQAPTFAHPLRCADWADLTSATVPFEPVPVPADHPLWILYSSGTTGLPKPIVHGHGGILANGMVSVVLHGDLRPGDVTLWAVNTSWMVWNAHVLGLLAGAALVLYDGAITGPGAQPDWGFLWQLASRYRVTMLGAGAAFFHSGLKAGLVPKDDVDLTTLQCICSTGSPLSPEAYRWVYDSIKSDVWLNSVSGGTDIAAGFLVGSPTLPVYVGEMQCRALGADVQSLDDAGRPRIGEVGELVCRNPVPSMPLYFWNDPGRQRETESYFDSFKDERGRPIWRHGDWLRLVQRPDAVGGVIYGRSDATINRQGIRMGTGELYRAVEAVPEIVDSLVVDLEYLGRESYMALFVVLRPGSTLTPDLDARVRNTIRSALSPRHVPNEILQVDAVPKTLSGKKLELPVKKLLLGHPASSVVKRDALANPDSLDWYINFAARRGQKDTSS